MDYVRESYSAGAEQLPVLMVFLIQILFPIFIIPKQRMPCKGHLAAYLMRAPLRMATRPELTQAHVFSTGDRLR